MKKLFIVNSHAIAKRLQEVLGDEWYVASVGQDIMGMHFSSAVTAGVEFSEKYVEWMRDCVEHRITGQLIHL